MASNGKGAPRSLLTTVPFSGGQHDDRLCFPPWIRPCSTFRTKVLVGGTAVETLMVHAIFGGETFASLLAEARAARTELHLLVAH